MKQRTVTRRNPVAKALANRCYAPRIVRPKRGRGAYTRKPAHKGDTP
jgi:stalled ribosome alternative rescue factor ArfA